MGVIKIVSELKHRDGLPKDSVFNTWHFINAGSVVTSAEYTAASIAVMDFFRAVHTPSTLTLANWIGLSIDRSAGACTNSVYVSNATGPGGGWGSPILESPWTLPAGSGSTDMPAEVALCMSFHAATVGIPEHAPGGLRPKARRRNRVYLGPWTIAALTQDAADGRAIPAPTVVNAIRDAGSFLLTSLPASGVWWAASSPSDGLIRQVTGGWVDDAWDTQRRRGEEPKVRTTFGSATFRDDLLEGPGPMRPMPT